MTLIKKQSTKAGRPVKIKDGRNITLHLDEKTIEKAKLIGDNNISNGVRIAISTYTDDYHG